jgi:hypothetical protein
MACATGSVGGSCADRNVGATQKSLADTLDGSTMLLLSWGLQVGSLFWNSTSFLKRCYWCL